MKRSDLKALVLLSAFALVTAFDFFMSRYKEAYSRETEAFVEALVNDKPSPCSGEDGLFALIMALAAGKSAEEERWVRFEVT